MIDEEEDLRPISETPGGGKREQEGGAGDLHSRQAAVPLLRDGIEKVDLRLQEVPSGCG